MLVQAMRRNHRWKSCTSTVHVSSLMVMEKKQRLHHHQYHMQRSFGKTSLELNQFTQDSLRTQAALMRSGSRTTPRSPPRTVASWVPAITLSRWVLVPPRKIYPSFLTPEVTSHGLNVSLASNTAMNKRSQNLTPPCPNHIATCLARRQSALRSNQPQVIQYND